MHDRAATAEPSAPRLFTGLFAQTYETALASVPPEDRVAAFDADGTLWAEDVGDELFRRLAAAGRLTPPAGESLETESAWWQAYQTLRIQNPAHAYGWCCLAMAGLTVEEVEDASRRTAEEVFAHPTARHEVVRRWLRALRASGWKVWVVSASNRWVVTAGLRQLEMEVDRVIGVELATQEGRILPQLAAEVPQGPGKVAALAQAGVERVALAAGNTLGDLELLTTATALAVAVDPDPALYREARARGWPCLTLSSGPAA